MKDNNTKMLRDMWCVLDFDDLKKDNPQKATDNSPVSIPMDQTELIRRLTEQLAAAAKSGTKLNVLELNNSDYNFWCKTNPAQFHGIQIVKCDKLIEELHSNGENYYSLAGTYVRILDDKYFPEFLERYPSKMYENVLVIKKSDYEKIKQYYPSLVSGTNFMKFDDNNWKMFLQLFIDLLKTA